MPTSCKIAYACLVLACSRLQHCQDRGINSNLQNAAVFEITIFAGFVVVSALPNDSKYVSPASTRAASPMGSRGGSFTAKGGPTKSNQSDQSAQSAAAPADTADSASPGDDALHMHTEHSKQACSQCAGCHANTCGEPGNSMSSAWPDHKGIQQMGQKVCRCHVQPMLVLTGLIAHL